MPDCWPKFPDLLLCFTSRHHRLTNAASSGLPESCLKDGGVPKFPCSFNWQPSSHLRPDAKAMPAPLIGPDGQLIVGVAVPDQPGPAPAIAPVTPFKPTDERAGNDGPHVGGWTAKQIHQAVLTSFRPSDRAYGLNQLPTTCASSRGTDWSSGMAHATPTVSPQRCAGRAAISVLP
jgi:hypothetical protein